MRFMLKCALGVEESRLRTVTRPSWWPRTLPYFNFKTSSEVEKVISRPTVWTFLCDVLIVRLAVGWAW